MAKTLTTTSAAPIFVAFGHYQIASATRPGVVYDLKYNQITRRWECNCPDVRHNHNPECKHRRRLLEWKREQESRDVANSQATAIVESMSQDAGILAEIEALRQSLGRMEMALEIEQEKRMSLEDLLKNVLAQQDAQIEAIRQEYDNQIRAMDASLSHEQEKRMSQADTFSSSIMDLYEARGKDMKKMHVMRDEMDAMRAELDALKAQPAPAPAPAKAPQMEMVKDAKGNLKAYRVNGHEVIIGNGMAIGCKCGKPCKAFNQVDEYMQLHNK